MDNKKIGRYDEGIPGTPAGNLAGKSIVAAVIACSILIAAIFTTYAAAQKEVVVQVEGEQLEVRSFAANVGELLQASGVELGARDKVSPLPETPLEDGMTVVVRRAVPVTLQVAGEESVCHTAAETVGDLLQERKIALGEQDVVTPGLHAGLEPGMLVQVDRVTVDTVEEEVPLQFSVRRESDNSLSRGITKVVQRGVPGLERKTWEITYKNGQEVERRLVDSTVVQKPVEQVVKVGALQVASRGGQEFRFSRAYEMVATAYTYTGNNTYTGIKPRVGIVAVDPSVIPLGTRLFVEGYGYCRAMDIGSKIKGNRIDVFLETKSEAQRWGRKKVTVYVLE